MAELSYGGDELEKAMAEFNCGEDESESEQGIRSPVECWELVGSSPSSPLPEARGDIFTLEEAMAVNCDTGSSLQDDYFCCAHISADNEVLPLSTRTVMAERQSENEGNSQIVDKGFSSDSSDALVSVDSDTDAIENCATPLSVSPSTNSYKVHHSDRMCHDDHMCTDALMCHCEHMHYDDHMHIDALMCHCEHMHYDDHMHIDALVGLGDHMQHHDDPNHDDHVWHDEHPYYESCMCRDDHVHDNGDDSKQCKMDDVCGRHDNEIMEGDGGPHCVNEPDKVVEFAGANDYHGVYTSTVKGMESPSYARMSSQEVRDSYMSIEQSFVEGSNATDILKETDREVIGEVEKTQGSVDVQHGTVSACNSRQQKGFACASWIWTQLRRWQAQLGCANTIWCVTLAAAVMGVLVLGRAWQRLQTQNRTLRTQLSAKQKRITRLMFQLMQTKDSLSRIRRIPVICVKPSLQIPQDHF